MNAIGRQTKARSCRWGVAAALVLSVGAAGCDGLLEVDLPAAVTDEALDDPTVAPILVNSIMALYECAYSSFAMDASGMEDNFQMVTGVAGNYSQYSPRPGGGQCDTDVYSQEWEDPLRLARGMGYSTYQTILGWAVPDKSELLATAAIYTAAILDLFGEFYCEFAINEGPLLTPAQVLTVAEGWLDSADNHIAAGGDFAIEPASGTVTESAQDMANGLRARIQWARGDGAITTDVPDDFVAWVTREDGEKRRNMVSSQHGNGGGTQASGFLQKAVTTTLQTNTSDSYSISVLGNKPNDDPWPDPVPFTGYIDLAIETATGRAVDDLGNALTLADAGTEADTRVEHAIGPTAGGNDYVIQKYDELSDDIPIVNWKEIRLIQAEYAGNTQAGIDIVNSLRTADGLPEIGGTLNTYRDALLADAGLYRDMIIEERRRALWLEARFWATKLKHPNELWFPRGLGDWLNASTYTLGGGVRLLMPNAEYQVNPNLANNGGLALRATGCDPDQAPVGFGG